MSDTYTPPAHKGLDADTLLSLVLGHLGPTVGYRAGPTELRVWGDTNSLFGTDAAQLEAEGTDAWTERILPADRRRVQRALATHTDGTAEYRLSYRIEGPDGTPIWIEDTGRTTNGPDGPEREGLLVDVREARETSRRIGLLERDLSDQRRLLDSVQNAIETHLLVLDGDGHVLLVNDAWLAYEESHGSTHTTPDAWIGHDARTLLQHDETALTWSKEALQSLQQVLDGTMSEYRDVVRAQTQWDTRWFQIIASPFRGSTRGALITRQDVTALKHAEETVVEQSTFLNSILDAARHLGILALDRDNRIAFFNPAAERIFGLPEADVVGRPLEVIEEQLGLPSEQLRRLTLTDHAASEHVYETRTFAGARDRLFENRLTPVEAPDGSVLGHVLLARDITDERTYLDRVERLNEELEQRVRERTAELERSQANLMTAQRMASIGSGEWSSASGQMEWSPQLFTLLGIDPATVRPSVDAILAAVHPDDVTTVKAWIDALMDGEPRTTELQFRLRRGGDDLRVVDASARREVPTDGEVRIVAALQDVTERVRMLEDLRTARDRAELASQAKSAFLANMSHEIRTPMNAILGMSDLVLESRLDDHQYRLMRSVSRSAKSLMGILNDILDVSKLEADHVVLESLAFDLADLVSDVIQLVHAQATSKGLELFLDVADDVPPHVTGDPTRLRQVLTNLVGNAVKFTDEGHVLVRITAGSGPDRVRISVEDSGIGIAPEKLQQIFDRFMQEDQTTTRRYGGTGLGTSIAKGLIERMGGSLTVESELGAGSTFHVELPLPAAPAGAVASTVDDARVQNWTRPLRVLIVDDIEANQLLVRMRLEARGHDVVCVEHGQAAVDRVQGERFDIVLMDAHMPVMDGLEATRTIRRLERAEGRARLPIVMLTASVLPEDQAECFAAGADAFVGKPVDFDELFDAIAGFFEAGPRRILAEPDAPADLGSLLLDTIDVSAGLDRWADGALYGRMAGAFLETYASAPDVVVDLVAEGRIDDAIAYLHGLKGYAANLAARRIPSLVDAVEARLKSGATDVTVSVAEWREAWAPFVEDLALVTAQAQRSTAGADATRGTLEVQQRDRALALLSTMTDTLRAAEFPEEAVDELATLLSAEDLAPLLDALDTFEFDEAIAQVEALSASLQGDETA